MKSTRVAVGVSVLLLLSVAACSSSTSDAGGTVTAGAAGSSGTTPQGGSDGVTNAGGASGASSGGEAGISGNGGASGAGSGAGGSSAGGGAMGGDAGAAGASSGGSAGTASTGGAGGGGGASADSGATGGSAGSAGTATVDAGEAGVISGPPGPVPGTVSIFDGKTLDGWEQGSAKLWSVVDGTLDGKSPAKTGGQLLVTKATYGDFRVIVSSKMVLVGGSGHLGICFWGDNQGSIGSYSNCKLIIPPGGNTWDYKLATGLKGVTKTTNPMTNPDWNTTEILCFFKRGFCRVAINGTAVLTYQEPNLTTIHQAPIGLQIHAGTNEEVQYKDVFVDPAPTEDKLLTLK